MNSRRFENGQLDAVDAALLRALAENARLPIAELARRVGLSAPSVAERIRRLEAAGVIAGYGLEIEPRALGLSLTAWLRIRPLPGQVARVAELVRELPEIVACDRITGDDCFLARAQLRSVEALEALIDRILPYAITNTAIVQSSPVARRLPPLSPEA